MRIESNQNIKKGKNPKGREKVERNLKELPDNPKTKQSGNNYIRINHYFKCNWTKCSSHKT